jgi:uncharacterized protein (DUF2126 family)/transglutaminase-like putative cysteine protease
MPITVSLHHKTKYSYDRPVKLAPHVLRLRPAPHCRTPIRAYSLKIKPARHFLNWQQDPFGNYQARLVFPHETESLEVDVDLTAELVTINPFDFFVEESAEKIPFSYDERQLAELGPYLAISEGGPRLEELRAEIAADVARPGRRTIDVLVDVNRRVQQLLRYDTRMEPGVFPPEETLARGHGSCRDFSWLLVQLLRRLGFAARFVSGYSIQLKADMIPIEGPAGVREDVTDLHAWAEVLLPGAGWIGLDATSGLLCGEGHIPLACTAEPDRAAPITGGYSWTPRAEGDAIREAFSFEMRVLRSHEPPRVTKPYTAEQWSAIDALGRRIDGALSAGDVRLSMGGEPTFVSIDDPDGPEWNTAALGRNKARLADDLVWRLQRRFAPGGLVHYGQGKWYPGEPLPRWALTCYFRRDGVPLWRRPELVAHEGGLPPAADAPRALMQALARELGVDARFALPAHEDAFYYLWRERRLPVNVDPLDSKLDDPLLRARLARIFERGLNAVAGYVLPLAAEIGPEGERRFKTGRWFLRGERMELIPGDSPLGFRLPLDSLPWVVPEDRMTFHEPDPFAPRAPLHIPRYALAKIDPGTLEGSRAPRDGVDQAEPGRPRRDPLEGDAPKPGVSASGLLRTAICVEPREGMLHVFAPPVEEVDDWVDLVAAIERAASSVGTPVRIEGYPPPGDPRLGKFAVTPDPGVIEVNIHPAFSWGELAGNTEILYEEARQARLTTEKFMLDGRHAGTGGGNHVVLGGGVPADSPFLRRPDMLRSLVGYFVNHPSLSYLFSGMFVGPTSQAPRVDEARQESIDELEIAFAELDTAPPGSPSWLVDRVLRNLLVDITGNTHRTEMCIDKLFSPDSASGRQGLVELRSFEMPPHPRMSLTQQLLLRGLVATFWNEPYKRRLVRWGTALHDKFLLPHFLEQDLGEVLHDLRAGGFDFDPAWFGPHLDFRFPVLGALAAGGVALELRQAIEPWPVLGEEAAIGGTARYVDSSLERIEVKVRGFDDRFVVACNGHRVPLHPTGTAGEHVAGVRYRAWQPPNALHPRIGVHAPLTFDLVDEATGRALAGCTYHVSHPGGRSFDQLPRNALEAESRRAARFQAFGHTPGTIRQVTIPPRAEPPTGFPMTLDLRK